MGLIAADLAGDLTVINGELADSLTAIIRNPDESERLRAGAGRCTHYSAPVS
jgi:hypothetical protein